jgi:NAD(P)-dependent dehydrogenase (short-subunit alcohol dehydrogenase family)
VSPELVGTRAFVTGGGTGIGRASAVALVAQGCFITVAGRTRRTPDETVALVRGVGGSAAAVLCDVTDAASVASAVAMAADEDGRLDFGVNSAGVSGGDDLRPPADYSQDQFDRMIDIGLRGTFLSMKYELRHMVAFGRGSIVTIASGAGIVGVPGFAGYVAAKPVTGTAIPVDGGYAAR